MMMLILLMMLYSIGAIIVFELWYINKRSTTKDRVLAYISSVLFPVTVIVAIVIGLIEIIKEKME